MSDRPRVFVTRNLPGRAIEVLREQAEVEVWPGEMPPSPEEFRDRAASCDAILTLLTDKIDEALLDAAPSLLIVSNMATGFDNVDVAAAARRNVLVTRTPGVLSETTADFAFALILAAARRVVEGDCYAHDGSWRTWGPETLLGHDVYGATLGIVGMGGIGMEVAKRARGFGMRILYTSRTRKLDVERDFGAEFRSLEDLLRESDFVTLHAPLTDETRQMINERTLRLMKPTAVLINTGRGPLIDQAALYVALKEGVIAGAALDVTDPEPMPKFDPLLTLPNVIVTPHIASASVATRSRMGMLAAENLLAALRGEVPEHAVNPEIADSWRERLKVRFG
ncbi:MAG: D-glycerate dehydrogenase [Chloroflexota bacterium]